MVKLSKERMANKRAYSIEERIAYINITATRNHMLCVGSTVLLDTWQW